MNIRDIHKRLALALLLRILLTSNRTLVVAVVAPGQFSNYQPQSYYSQSLPSYDNENQNYYDNPGELNPSDGYQPQQFPPTSYGGSDAGFDADGDGQNSYQQSELQNSFQPQTSYQDYLSGHFSPFKQEQDSALGNYGRQYATRQSVGGGGRGTSSLVSFDNIDFNNSEPMNYQPAEDVIYPPLDSGMHQHHHQPHSQQYDFMKANDYASLSNPSGVNFPQSPSYLSVERAVSDNAVAANAEALTMHRPPTPRHVHHQMNASPYIEHENQYQYQQDQQQHIPTSSQRPSPPLTHFESQYSSNNDRLLNSSSSRSYYVADSDLSPSGSNHPLETHPVSLVQNHLVQVPAMSSLPLPLSAPPPAFPVPSEPITISKHVEITKHVPVPIYRQIHVPYRKPVRIEIPRSVISTVPRPYPIQIPSVTKTVAVPLVREVKIPIEKVTPYPVEHKVPYVVEKRVPFQVERQVAAPVFFPYPIKVPMVRTILHKKKAHRLPQLHYHHPRIHM